MATELSAVRAAMLHAHDVLHNARSMLPESDAGHAEIGEAMRGLRDAAALAAPPVEQQAAAELDEMRARKDAAYEERNRVVAALASAFPSGISRTAIEGWSEDWHGCVYIDLPTGQASWHYHDTHAHLFAHLPPYVGAWDGHTTPEKYERLAGLAQPAPQAGAADPWRQALDDELIQTENCVVDGDDPKTKLQELIDWHVMVALDPAVSKDAEALIQRGRDEAAHPTEQPSQDASHV